VADCIFCRVGRHEVPADIVFEDPLVLAFRDIHPVAPTHVLVIPKQHITALWELDEHYAPLISRLILACNDVATQLGIDSTGYRVVANAGPDAGQSVDHLHFHVLGGKRMGWPPFPPPADELPDEL
jgi:histidine triad (HIT) family protein